MAIESWLTDMDGVLVHEANAIPGADRFLDRLRERELPFLLLTNNSIYTRRDLAAGCRRAASTSPRSRSGPRPGDRPFLDTSGPAAPPSSSARPG